MISMRIYADIGHPIVYQTSSSSYLLVLKFL